MNNTKNKKTKSNTLIHIIELLNTRTLSKNLFLYTGKRKKILSVG